MGPSVLAANLRSESFALLVLVHGVRYSRPRRSISDIEFTEKKPLSARISPSLDPTAETFSRHKLMILRRDSRTGEDLSMYRAARISRDLELTHCAVMYVSNLLVPSLRPPPLRSEPSFLLWHDTRCISIATPSTPGSLPSKQSSSSCALTAWLKVSSALPSPVLDRISRNYSSLGE